MKVRPLIIRRLFGVKDPFLGDGPTVGPRDGDNGLDRIYGDKGKEELRRKFRDGCLKDYEYRKDLSEKNQRLLMRVFNALKSILKAAKHEGNKQ